jgi:ribosomal protein S1
MHDFVKEGDQIKVKILEFVPEDRRLKLGIKQLAQDPWADAAEKYSVGSKFTGKVIDVKPFGIFVEIEKGVDVFIHQSDFSWNGKKVYNLGDTVEFKITEINEDENKLKGSIKLLTKSPWEEALEMYKVGDIIEKPIKSIQDFGIFINLAQGVDGFIPVQLASKDFVKKLTDKYTTGQIVKAEIVEIDDEKHRVKLSIKKVENENEKRENRELIEKYGISESK